MERVTTPVRHPGLSPFSIPAQKSSYAGEPRPTAHHRGSLSLSPCLSPATILSTFILPNSPYGKRYSRASCRRSPSLRTRYFAVHAPRALCCIRLSIANEFHSALAAMSSGLLCRSLSMPKAPPWPRRGGTERDDGYQTAAIQGPSCNYFRLHRQLSSRYARYEFAHAMWADRYFIPEE